MAHIKCNKYGACGGCGKCQPLNQSNKTLIIPVPGASAYLDWLAYNPNLDPNVDPDSPWTEEYWLENYVKGEQGDTPYIGSNGNWWIGDVDTGVSASGGSVYESTQW